MRRVEEWEARSPEVPGLADAARGAAVGLGVLERLNQDEAVRNDKWKHCVVGFEIALATNLATAEYAGWLKEHQDLTDGDPTTSFDEDDYAATVDVARQAAADRRCEGCRDVCEQRWGDRHQPWSGG